MILQVNNSGALSLGCRCKYLRGLGASGLWMFAPNKTSLLLLLLEAVRMFFSDNNHILNGAKFVIVAKEFKFDLMLDIDKKMC